MKIAVVAANGRSGLAFVKQALAEGHEVNAGYMGDSSHLPAGPGITKIMCDATKIEDVRTLITGQDAVVSLIGHVKGSAADVQTVSMQHIVSVMQELGVRRLVSLTGTGVRFPGDRITITDRILNLAITIIDPNRVHDGMHHAEVIQHSNLDWTVIRVLKLQNVPAKPFTLSTAGPTKPYVGREEVAQAILQVLHDNSFLQQAPMISK